MSTELKRVALIGGPLDGREFFVGIASEGAYVSVPGRPGGLYGSTPDEDPDVWVYGGANA
ncbi:hypothetical protein [Planomonospora parontospora]|uniref:hypothetical protein n=1 Tax=Planomonospora parontospora TaxID=58119 RepID=UPI00167038B9|nr:hypothetical protein [Planomonospora parontospora]